MNPDDKPKKDDDGDGDAEKHGSPKDPPPRDLMIKDDILTDDKGNIIAQPPGPQIRVKPRT